MIVKGKDKTDSILSYRLVDGKCEVIYKNSCKPYIYNCENVRILKLQSVVDVRNKIVWTNTGVAQDAFYICHYGEFCRIVFRDKTELSYKKEQIRVIENCLSGADSRSLFDYFKETAQVVGLVAEDDNNILSNQYEKVSKVSAETVLAIYLNEKQPPQTRKCPPLLIYPFGLNESQKVAVENAFSSQVSFIQGPPGTGKTQTILNVVANIVLNGKTVAVVSQNNSAIQNIIEKLEKENLSFLSALLGNANNKNKFIESQNGTYPEMENWKIPISKRNYLRVSLKILSQELNKMFWSKNRIAQIEQQLLHLKIEQQHFRKFCERISPETLPLLPIQNFSASQIMDLWLEYEQAMESGGLLSWLKKLLILLRYNRTALLMFQHTPQAIIPYLQRQYYDVKILELCTEKKKLEKELKLFCFEEKLAELQQGALRLFRAELAERYDCGNARRVFDRQSFYNNANGFNLEYPIVLSTTYSIKGTLATNHVYDYLIVDEASQVDLATAVLAFSCARNIVIVGDTKQLPNVLSSQTVEKATRIWKKYSLSQKYCFVNHSLLSSALSVWPNAPTVLLKEHYRCHPKIAEFFNQKFYNGQLIVMTKDKGEQDVLAVYQTVPGNHARGHLNQRQIDVIKKEVLPRLKESNYQEIGVIAPYRDQVEALQEQLKDDKLEIATVHKFQGREKDAIILSSVDNQISPFVDDGQLLNVAVSRAVFSLSIVTSSAAEKGYTNFGDLIRYIKYNNFLQIQSNVFSVFDLLYHEYAQQRKEFLKGHLHISEYDSENLMYALIENVLSLDEFVGISCVPHVSLVTLIQSYQKLTVEERTYAKNPLTHVDFLLFKKIDKEPILAIEVDGTYYHTRNRCQAQRDEMKNRILKKIELPLARFRTNESSESERLKVMIRFLMTEKAQALATG